MTNASLTPGSRPRRGVVGVLALVARPCQGGGQDAPRGGAGHEVEEVGDAAPRAVLDLGQDQRRDDPPDPAAVDREDAHVPALPLARIARNLDGAVSRFR